MNNQGLDALAAAAASNTSYPSTGSIADRKHEAKSDISAINNEATTHPVNSSIQQGIAAQQWQQAIANAAASINVLSGAGSQNNLALMGMQQLNQGQANASNPNLIALQQQLAMQQQLNYFQLLAHAANQQQRQFNANQGSSTIVPGAVTGAQPPFPNMNGTSPVASSTVAGFPSPNLLQPVVSNTLPMLNVSQASTTQQAPVNSTGFQTQIPQPATASPLTAIAPQPQKTRSSISATDWSDDDNADESEYYTGDKRQLKRVANRKSAQLSRKRKKQFIEELKEENDGLRRKEQILRSIPDLVVVFDSSGKLWFVSESVSRFLDFTAVELEGTSFWNRLCDDSVRLLKAAFMDSLAARQTDAETASLGSGTWELRLVDKDGSRKVVTLHGVVHFAGDRPECVCSIRPSDESTAATSIRSEAAFVSASTSTNGSCVSSMKRHRKMLASHVKPSQSVVSSSDIANTEQQHLSDAQSLSTLRGNGAVRISDSGNSSGSSDSGSGDEMNANEIAA